MPSVFSFFRFPPGFSPKVPPTTKPATSNGDADSSTPTTTTTTTTTAAAIETPAPKVTKKKTIPTARSKIPKPARISKNNIAATPLRAVKRESTSATPAPFAPTTSRKRPRSPRSPPEIRPSPLVYRNPDLLQPNEEFVTPAEPVRADRAATPRSKRLRRRISEGFELVPAFAAHEPSEGPSLIKTATSTPGPSKLRSSESVRDDIDSPPPLNIDLALSKVAIAEETGENNDPEELDDLVNKHGFSVQEAMLFLRIRNRGFEPIMPEHWMVDFGTIPPSLFAHGDQVGHIDSITLDGTFEATKAFQNMISLGSIVRGKLEVGQDPEDRILPVIKKYIQWSVRDVKDHLSSASPIYPRLVLVGSNKLGAHQCDIKTARKLAQLSAEVRAEEAHLRSLNYDPSPISGTVYGIAVTGPIVALVTQNTRNPEAEVEGPKTMAVLDLSNTEMDFWNATAIALMVIAAREDELEREGWYRSVDVKRTMADPEEVGMGGKRRGWEVGRRESLMANEDYDVDK